MGFGSGKLPIYEVGATIDIALDSCMVSLKKVEANQASICSASGVTMIFPFLVSDVNRSGFLRILSCPITEDTSAEEEKTERVRIPPLPCRPSS
ncbi:hypothetical protein JHK85_027399 [Glycine max]|nr:hypothetical protein JHK85_027399 [Glycine max]